MKILKYILFGLLALVVLFFAVGVLKPTITYGHEITVDKPLREAWAVTKDESKYDQWLEGFQSIELIEGEKDQPGSKYRVVVDPGNGQGEFEMIETLLDIKEFEKVEMHYDSEFMDFEHSFTHAEKDGKATVTSEGTVKAKGLMMRSMFALMEMLTGSFTAQEQKNMEALKKVIEENTTDYYPAPPVPEDQEAPAENSSE